MSSSPIGVGFLDAAATKRSRPSSDRLHLLGLQHLARRRAAEVGDGVGREQAHPYGADRLRREAVDGLPESLLLRHPESPRGADAREGVLVVVRRAALLDRAALVGLAHAAVGRGGRRVCRDVAREVPRTVHAEVHTQPHAVVELEEHLLAHGAGVGHLEAVDLRGSPGEPALRR
jgi:hypothetical protein